MSKKGNLFLLIKSLTKSEKRYFKLFTPNGDGNQNYLQLFDFIDQQEAYDETAIKKHFAGEKFIRQLHVTKIYLSGLIMKSLRNYHQKISTDAEIKDLLRDVEILFRKDLPDQCHYTLEKAFKLANKHEKFHYLPEICTWKRKLLLSRPSTGKQRALVNEVLNQEKQAIDKLGRLHQYWHLTLNMFDILGPGADPEKAKVYQSLLDDSNQADTFQTRVLYYFLQQSQHYMRYENDITYQYARELVGFIENYPAHIQEEPNTYATALNNLIGVCLQLRKMEEVVSLIKKTKEIPVKYHLKNQKPFTIKMLAQTYNIELEFYRDTRQYKKSTAAVHEIQQFLSENHRHVPDSYKVLLHYQIAYLYFVQKQYSDALQWLNEIIGHSYGNVRDDIQSYGRILNLIIHFELGNILVLKYAVESTRRFLKKKRGLQPFEKEILRFFSKISTAPLGAYKPLFHQLQTSLFRGMDEQTIAYVLDYLDFKSWIYGKLY